VHIVYLVIMMNSHIVLSLDKRRARKDGSYSIVLRITHKRKTTSITTGISIPKSFWDEKKRRVRNAYKGVDSITRLNNQLSKKRSYAMQVIAGLEEKNLLHLMSLKQVKEKIVNQHHQSSFIEYGYELAEEMTQSKRIGNARSYRAVLGVLESYSGTKKLSFEELNYEFIVRWEADHLARGNAINGFTSYMRTIRAIYNRGIKAGLVDKEVYPFNDYQLKSTPTDKRAISVENMQKILNASFESETNLFHYRNYFIASYFLFGMNFMDMAFLKKENIIDGRIKYQRKKTAKQYNIKINDQLAHILDYYLAAMESEFIFPIIKRKTPIDQYKDVLWMRGRYNKGLKDIAEHCGITERLTSYVARHSFATQAMMNDIPLQAISAMLGHSKLSTTQIYLATLPTEMMDEYHDRIKL